MNGLFNIDKPAGMTSHDVVNVMRRLTHIRRIGHTGTLDPMATGVLIILVGPATRLSRFLMGKNKKYRAVIRLGQTTTTYDAEGELVKQRPVTVDKAELEQALAAFQGEILQIPPMYSAIKVNGKPLYKLAHQGKEIARTPRHVTIHSVILTDWQPPDLTVEVACSAGTYIRSLAYDLGEALGCGAHLTALTRTASGHFDLAESVSLDTLRELEKDGHLEEMLLPPQTALTLPSIRLTPEQVQAVCYGQTISLDDAPAVPELQATDAVGQLIAVLIPVEEGQWRPNLVLVQEQTQNTRQGAGNAEPS